jgi:excisionase family DNA binding protein
MADDRLLLTVRETAAALRISRNACYELIRRGELPVIRLGLRTLRVSRFGLEQWIAAQSRLAEPPPSTFQEHGLDRQGIHSVSSSPKGGDLNGDPECPQHRR